MKTVNSRGGRLRDGRREKGLTAEEAAKSAGVSKSTWLKWEYDQSFPGGPDQISLACSTAGISIDHFIDGRDCQPSLPTDQQELIKKYNELPIEVKESLLVLLRSMGAELTSE